MDVYWLEQTLADVPAADDWLSPAEKAQLELMKFEKRRADWRLGRWTAKRALAAYPDLDVPQCEVLPGPSGAPEVFLAGKPAGIAISISHRAGRAVCALAQSGAALGCDVELIEARSYAFVADYFTAEEQALVARAQVSDRSRLITVLWSAKESALKALHLGLRADTRSVIASPRGLAMPDRWLPLHVRFSDGMALHGWWRYAGDFVWTLAAAPQPELPILLPSSPGLPSGARA